jgi:hypothetical protein
MQPQKFEKFWKKKNEASHQFYLCHTLYSIISKHLRTTAKIKLKIWINIFIKVKLIKIEYTNSYIIALDSE